jgi:hypothetical protein
MKAAPKTPERDCYWVLRLSMRPKMMRLGRCVPLQREGAGNTGCASSGRQTNYKATTALVPKISKTTPCKVALWSLACAIPRRHLTRRANHVQYYIIAQTNLAPDRGDWTTRLRRPQHRRSSRAPLTSCPALRSHDQFAPVGFRSKPNGDADVFAEKVGTNRADRTLLRFKLRSIPRLSRESQDSPCAQAMA